MNTWEDAGNAQDADIERQIREAQREAAAKKAAIAKERGVTPNHRSMLFALFECRPNEGKIVRTAEGFEITVYYTKADLEAVLQRSPHLVPELTRELNGGAS